MAGASGDQDQEAPKRTGVVIVHGMGHPQPAELLDAIVRSLLSHFYLLSGQHWTPEMPAVEFLDLSDGRRHILVRYAGREWEFAEAHWAPHVKAPPFLGTIRWAIGHFLGHATLLAKRTLVSLLPAAFTLLILAATTILALALLPVLLLLTPFSQLITSLAYARVTASYRAHMARASDTPTKEEIRELFYQWRRSAPASVALLSMVVTAALAVAILAFIDRTPLVIGIAVYAIVSIGLLSLFWANNLTVEPSIGDNPPIAFGMAMDMMPSRAGLLRAQVPHVRLARLFEETLRDLVNALTLAPAVAAGRWLRINREFDLGNYLKWVRFGDRALPMLNATRVLAALLVTRTAASLTWFLFYLVGALLILPVAALLVAVSAIPRWNGPGSFLSRLKQRMEGLVLTSIGDINLFTRDPEQAAAARGVVEASIDALAPECESLHVVAHSLGCAVSYDTLVQPANAARVARVRSLVTVGGILPMVWRKRPHRESFDFPLPGHMRWLNLWARFDPAEGGPIGLDRLWIAMPEGQPIAPRRESDVLSLLPERSLAVGGFIEVAVSNSDNILLDHTSYWQNGHEVMPRIARMIWSGDTAQLDAYERADAIRAFRQRDQIVASTGTLLATGYAVILAFFYFDHSITFWSLYIGMLLILTRGLTRPDRKGFTYMPPESDNSLPRLRSEQLTSANGMKGITVAVGGDRLNPLARLFGYR